MTFEKFLFSEKQIKSYYANAKKDLAKVLEYQKDGDISFRFGYDALIKLAVAVCAHEGLRVLARAGHHMELIEKMALILKNDAIRGYGNEMRKKRNLDFYGGGVLLTEKEAKIYVEFIRKIFALALDFFDKKKGMRKLL